MRRIGDIIAKLLESDPKFENLKRFEVISVWKEVVGESISSKARVVGFERGVLKVECDDPLWSSELRLRSEDIKRRMNEKLERVKVEKIEIRRGWRWGSTRRVT